MSELTEPLADAAPLRLVALDAEDLAVMSAHLQDASLRVGDMIHLPRMRRFALTGSRFDWPSAKRGLHRRCAIGLHFESVLKVMRIGFEQAPGTVLHLMAIVFLPGEAPGGTILLSFAGGSALRLDVECLEAAMSDMGPRWSVDQKSETAL